MSFGGSLRAVTFPIRFGVPVAFSRLFLFYRLFIFFLLFVNNSRSNAVLRFPALSVSLGGIRIEYVMDHGPH